MPNILCKVMAAPAYSERLAGTDAAKAIDRAAPAKLPVLRKSDLPTLHAAAPPFDRVRFALQDSNID